jgi:hypothetical protein
MTHYHAVFLDETGCEFGAGIDAPDAQTAYAEIQEQYPECRIVQFESPEDRRKREQALWDEVNGDYWDQGWLPENENDDL